MRIGISNEENSADRRVALIPSAVHALIQAGAEVVVEAGAGQLSGFSDQSYREAGAKIVYSKEEVGHIPDVLLKVAPISFKEVQSYKDELAVFSFHHLAVSPEKIVKEIAARKLTVIGYEIIEDAAGDLPILKPMSYIGGQQSVLVAARCLQSHIGGKGIILGGIPGIPPANVVILGGGNVGFSAALSAVGLGAQVMVLDTNMNKLEQMHRRFERHVGTMLSNTYNISKAVAFADVVIGAVLVHGQPTPKLITESMIKSMKSGSVIVDVSIDQGGCSESSHPTTMESPVYMHADVVHYCVPNIASNVSRMSSIALSNAILPFLEKIVARGLAENLQNQLALQKGVYAYRGAMISELLSRMFQLPFRPLPELLKETR